MSGSQQLAAGNSGGAALDAAAQLLSGPVSSKGLCLLSLGMMSPSATWKLFAIGEFH